MLNKDHHSIIARELGLSVKNVDATIQLIDDACTTPFIARYRKELTGGLDELQIENIRAKNQYYTELIKRKKTILDTIAELGKLDADLKAKIESCWDAHVLEDIYLPYKPKRKTRASIAREKGLEPLALWLLKEYPEDPYSMAERYLNKGAKDADEALQGARDIVAEMINENAQIRERLRNLFQKRSLFQSKLVKSKEAEAQNYRDYFAFDEPLQRCPSHRVLAMFRGEEEGFLRLAICPEEDDAIDIISRQIIRRNSASSKQLELAVSDSYKRLLLPSLENEIRAQAKARADDDAILVFADNLRQLLLSPPLGSKRVLAIDPGFRSGCKVVALDEAGNLLSESVAYIHEPQREVVKSEALVRKWVQQYQIEAIAIGNGTAGRETESFIRGLGLGSAIAIYMVSENGASVYSASAIAREEFPDYDVTVRGAISIGRRLIDPLAELVKIDPKAIGVGQYQHDVDQNKLKEKLEIVVQHCVNQVGVNVNTASKSLLMQVSGLNAQTAQQIVAYRAEKGAFKNRTELKKVPRLGPKAFEQCAAFLRIPGAKNVLDNSAVHPESYEIVEAMAKKLTCSVLDLMKDENKRKQINIHEFINERVGLPTLTDIMNELAKPGRDPRGPLLEFKFSEVKKMEDLYEGMVLPGIVTNITRFGCFVDIGVKQDGMVHISQLADQYVADPNTIVKLQQQVKVKVLEVDLERKRISLSMKL
ncbi:MAG: RNA-binding transcriptional accessory protein [Bacteroidia bacterium]|nr:RNA-binding transcriptional accessory protein [Bacteroidia bacterium]